MPDSTPTLCTAVIVRHPSTGRVLLLRRRPDTARYPGLWVLPGGMVEPEELAPECARREVFEETGVRAYSLKFLGTTHHNGLEGLVFEATAFAGEPINAEPEVHDAIGWFDPAEPPGMLMAGAAEVLGWVREGRVSS